MTDYAIARHNMVEGQIRTNKVTDAALVAAFETVPRELFVPAHLRSLAYIDEDIRVADDRYLMEPMVLARLLQAAEVRPGDIALDIGCATGYSTAILARLCDAVVGLECDKRLAGQASEILTELGVDTAAIVEGPLESGQAKQGPYNVILFNGAVARVPDTIFEQLAEGGRLVAVRNTGEPMGRAFLYLRASGVVSGRPIFDAATPDLPGFAPAEAFTF